MEMVRDGRDAAFMGDSGSGWEGARPVEGCAVVEWECCGMTCLLGHGPLGNPCGYVVLPSAHPLARASEERIGGSVSVHGGITFATQIGDGPRIVGFDMGHACDMVVEPAGCYCVRTDGECAAETERLAAQLAAIASYEGARP